MIFNVGGGANTANQMPAFTYTGSYDLIDDGKDGSVQNWRIMLKTSGVLTFQRIGTLIDVFCVGGGGGGGKGDSTLGRGCGGGGGYTKTNKGVSVQEDVVYTIEIGGGGAANSDGGSTSAFNIVAEGGKCGVIGRGGAGGSGGGGCGGAGGSDGSDGFIGTYHSPEPGGSGQGTTTREFGESNGTLYAGGGGGNAWGGSSTNFGKGGEGGGGDGRGSSAAEPGTTNTGGGGGATNGAGGSGIVVIRNHR